MSTDNNQDPVVFCIDALMYSTNKEAAFEQALIAYNFWNDITAEEIGFKPDEMEQFKGLRAIAFATIATVFVWNDKHEYAFSMEEQFLHNKTLWTGKKKEAIDAYLMYLIMYEQVLHLEKIFEDNSFREVFLPFEDVYQSFLNHHYPYQSETYKIVRIINNINALYRIQHGKNFMG